jgi:hypothetical protein
MKEGRMRIIIEIDNTTVTSAKVEEAPQQQRLAATAADQVFDAGPPAANILLGAANPPTADAGKANFTKEG